MTKAEATHWAQSLRAQARVGRAVATQRGADWSDYSLVVDIALDLEAEADELEASGLAAAEEGVAQVF